MERYLSLSVSVVMTITGKNMYTVKLTMMYSASLNPQHRHKPGLQYLLILFVYDQGFIQDFLKGVGGNSWLTYLASTFGNRK